MSSRSIARSGLLLLVFLAWASPALAQLCTGPADPCVISSNTAVPSGTVLDIGTKGLVIGPSVTLTVQGAGFLTVHSGPFTMETNAKIVANGTGGFGGIIVVVAGGPFEMKGGSLIDVGAANGGTVDVTATTGNVLMNGRVQGDATTREGFGGDVSFIAIAGDVTVGGLGINVNGGDRFAGGGTVYLDGFGDTLLAANVQNRGSDGGSLEMFAGGNATVANGVEVNLKALDVEFGDGGDTCMEAGGDVIFAGTLFASGSGDGPENGGGDGGYTDFLASGDIVVSGTITAEGSADGSGGDVDLDGVNVSVTGPMDLTGPGQGDGGNLFVLSTVSSFLNSAVDVRAGTSGGSFSFGGSVDVISDAAATAGPLAVLRTTGTFQAGTIDFFGCNVTIQNGAVLESLGPATANSGTNTIQASGLATIGGVAEATTSNRVRYRTMLPVVAPQAGTSPAWAVSQNASLPCCIGCPTTTTTTSTSSTSTTSTSSSTTTSTSSSSTSTTSTSTSTTSSTSTSIPGSTTTTSTSLTTSTSSTSTSTTTTIATSTSTTSTTSTSTTMTTASSTSTSSTSTSSSTSSSSSTTTTLATTTTIDVGTTSTTVVLGCAGLMDFEAASCELGELQEDVTVRSDDDLGGKRPARGLRKRVEKSLIFIERASVETKLKKTQRFVKRSRKKLESFEKKVARFSDKGKIDVPVASELLAKSGEAKIQIEAIEVGLSQQ